MYGCRKHNELINGLVFKSQCLYSVVLINIYDHVSMCAGY